MRPNDRKKERDKIAVVLMMCFCVVALTAIFTIKSNIDKISKNHGDIPVSDKTKTDQRQDATTKDNSEKETSTKIPTVVNKDNSKEKNSTEKDVSIQFTKPVLDDYKISKKYSMDMVVYSKTLDQFMTHSGIDIEAARDSKVKAIASGTITDVYTDDGYGLTIEITHDNGYISKYCNLSTDKMVEKGDKIKQGQTISGIGTTAMFESSEGPHLHLEVLKNDKFVDPAKLIKF